MENRFHINNIKLIVFYFYFYLSMSWLDKLPSGIFRDMIIPYTYTPQPQELLDDIRSYYLTMSRIHTEYKKRFPEPDERSLEWLSNDITRFLNNDTPIMFGFSDFHRIVFRRLYINHDSRIPALCESFTDIKVSIGLLRPDERVQLETFLEGHGSGRYGILYRGE